MRIIGGKFKNKKIFLPTDKLTRPLKDIVRESIFNIIEHSNLIENKILNSSVLDLYSGSGSFGLECLSRGASKVVFCENYLPAFKILKKNLNDLNFYNQIELFNEEVLKVIEKSNNYKKMYDIIFMDPPYKENKINELLIYIFEKKIIKKNSLLILHRNKKTKEKFPINFQVLLERTYGSSKIYFGKF
tara:strand:- start:477 stop:1040 length:564 start_codon:yes stop_codon:yes gene_type:complete